MRYRVQGLATDKWHFWKDFNTPEEAKYEALAQCASRLMDFRVIDMKQVQVIFNVKVEYPSKPKPLRWQKYGF